MTFASGTHIVSQEGRSIRSAAFVTAGLIGMLALWASLFLRSDPQWHIAIGVAAFSQFVCVVFAFRGLSSDGVFSPIVWFSAMYFLLPIMVFYLASTHFGEIYHHNIAFRSDRIDLMVSALLVALVGYFAYIVGDIFAGHVTSKRTEIRLDLGVRRSVLLGIAFVCYAVGILNFAVNAWLYDSGDLTSLLVDFGARSHRLDRVPGFFTTIGYNLLIVALVIHMYARLRYFGTVGRTFLVLAIVSGVVMLSTGRVWYTFSAGLAIFSCWHVCTGSNRTGRMLVGVALVIGLLLLAFIFRIVSNLVYIEAESTASYWFEFFSQVGGDLAYLIIGRSNIPSLPILMEVIGYYGSSAPYLGGRSLFYWTTYLVPGSDVHFLGHEIKELFYSGRPGGFPPTIFGELYANGGIGLVLAGCCGLGFLIKRSYLAALQARRYIAVFVYCALLFRFVFMLPKLELAALGSALWLVVPVGLVWVFLVLLSQIDADLGSSAREMTADSTAT